MLRITRTKKSTFLPADKQDTHNFSQYQQLTKLVKKYLSPVTASIFSKPVLIDNSEDLEWYSVLQGQPQPLLSLPEDQQLNAKKLLTDRLAAISKLADQLPQLESNSEELQSLLRKAIQFYGCDKLKKITKNDTYLKSSDIKFATLNIKLKNHLDDCKKTSLASLPKVFGAEFVEGFAVLHIKQRNVLEARFQTVANGLLKIPGVSRRQLKKNSFKYNRANRIVRFNIKKLGQIMGVNCF